MPHAQPVAHSSRQAALYDITGLVGDGNATGTAEGFVVDVNEDDPLPPDMIHVAPAVFGVGPGDPGLAVASVRELAPPASGEGEDLIGPDPSCGDILPPAALLLTFPPIGGEESLSHPLGVGGQDEW